jgi:hypothetical protein
VFQFNRSTTQVFGILTMVRMKPEQAFKKVSCQFLQQAAAASVDEATMQKKEEQMKKLTYALAAVATLAIGAPTIANAAGFGVYVGGDRDDYYGPRARIYEHDRGWHHGWYHDRDYDRGVVIRRHHWDND